MIAKTKHFSRWASLEERFEAKVDRTPGHGPWGDCHLWLASTNRGYGVIKVNGHYERAHRVALTLAGIHVEEDTHHRCEVKLCVNVDHLKPIPHDEHPAEHRRERCKRGHSLDDAYIRPDTGVRQCRACRRERKRA